MRGATPGEADCGELWAAAWGVGKEAGQTPWLDTPEESILAAIRLRRWPERLYKGEDCEYDVEKDELCAVAHSGTLTADEIEWFKSACDQRALIHGFEEDSDE